MKNNVFNLQIIPIEKIRPHEQYDKRRARPLIKRLKMDKQLTNPIIVASLGDGDFLQLDGMNRLSAFQMMGLPTILAQIIDYNDQENVELASWGHLFRRPEKHFLKYASEVDDLKIKPGRIQDVGYRYIKAEGWGRLCTVVSRRGKVYLIRANGNLAQKVDKLCSLVSFYKSKIVRDALPLVPSQSDMKVLFKEHPSCNMLMVFPTFTRHQIISIIKKDGLFPPGVTRHLIKRRCLHINVPLSLFRKKMSVEKKNEELDKMLRTRAFRLYEEPTIYFE